MSGKEAKRLRKQFKKTALASAGWVKTWVNLQKCPDRLRTAWAIIRGKWV